MTRIRISLFFLIFSLAGGCTASRMAGAPPAGEVETAQTRVLESGAQMLQTDAPPDALDVYMVGFHAAKQEPAHQMEAHHFCRQVNQDFAQCALFDGNTKQANLIGIECIISEKLFESLPANEKRYWHPHNYEILSGTLIAPSLPAPAEQAFMKDKLNSYGKTWHVWNTAPFWQTGDKVPLGDPQLMWSFNRDGEAEPDMIEERDRSMGLDSAAKRRERADLAALAHPQEGVDAMKGQFPRPTTDVPGVIDKDAAREVH